MIKATVIVPTYNSKGTIDGCLASLLALDYPQLQIIFADDGSSDGTHDLLATRAQASPAIELASQEHRGLAAARNLGASRARGDILCFTDHDCQVPIDWVSRLAAHFSGPSGTSLGVVGGAQDALPPLNIYTELAQRRRDSIYGTNLREVAAVPGCNFGLRRDLLERVGGFDKGFTWSGEEYDICYRISSLGFSILYDPGIRVLHHHPQSLGSTWHKSYLHGREWIRLRRKHPYRATRPPFSLYRQILSSPPKQRSVMLKLLALAGLYSIGTLCGNAVGLGRYRPPPGRTESPSDDC